jgi:hypothetical protein
MFKLDYLPLKSTDGTIVPAWFACQNVRGDRAITSR